MINESLIERVTAFGRLTTLNMTPKQIVNAVETYRRLLRKIAREAARGTPEQVQEIGERQQLRRIAKGASVRSPYWHNVAARRMSHGT